MKRFLILAAMATPIAAQAQQATVEDKVAAAEATNADLLSLVTNLRAQIVADQRQIADLKKQVPTPAPSAPSAAEAPKK